MATLKELSQIAPKALGGEAKAARDVEELLEAVIAYANGDLRLDRTELRRQKFGWRSMSQTEYTIDRGVTDLLAVTMKGKRALDRYWAVSEFGYRPIGVSATPKVRVENGSFRIDWRIMGNDANTISLARFAVAALAARTDGDALPISRCSLGSCGKFFIVRKQPGEPGRVRTKYCSPEHTEAAHREGSHERVRRSRERKRLASRQKQNRRMPK